MRFYKTNKLMKHVRNYSGSENIAADMNSSDICHIERKR